MTAPRSAEPSTRSRSAAPPRRRRPHASTTTRPARRADRRRRRPAAGDAARRRTGRLGVVQLRLGAAAVRGVLPHPARRPARASAAPTSRRWSATTSASPPTTSSRCSTSSASSGSTCSATAWAAVRRCGSRSSYPDRVGRLVLMGPGGLSLNLFHADPTEGVKRLMDFGAEPDAARRCGRSSRPWSSTRTWSPTSWSRSGSPTRPRPARGGDGARWACRSGTRETAEDGMLWREAHQLRKHTLLTWGREDRVNPLDGAHGRAQADPEGDAARVPQLRALGADRGGRRVRRGRHQLPGPARREEQAHDDRHQVHGLRPRRQHRPRAVEAVRRQGARPRRGPRPRPGQPVLADRPGLRPARGLPLRRRPARRASAGRSPTTRALQEAREHLQKAGVDVRGGHQGGARRAPGAGADPVPRPVGQRLRAVPRHHLRVAAGRHAVRRDVRHRRPGHGPHRAARARRRRGAARSTPTCSASGCATR